MLELLIAAALFLAALSSFVFVLKNSAAHLTRAHARAKELYGIRSELERLQRLAFSALPAAASGETQVTPVAADLCLVRVKTFYTLRSKY